MLAGHSFGGLYVLTYAANYPDDVAGMVLVDSTAPKPPSGKAATSSDLTNRVTALLSTSARLGVVRLLNLTAYDSLPPQARDEAAATGSTASTMRSTLDEYVQGNASMADAGALTDFADKPLFVLTAGEGIAPTGRPSRIGWPSCRRTAHIRLSRGQNMPHSSTRRSMPPKPPRQSSTSSQRSEVRVQWFAECQDRTRQREDGVRRFLQPEVCLVAACTGSSSTTQ